VASSGLILASTSANAAFVIVEETFDGAGTAGLGGTTAETFDSAITTAGGSDTWTASGYFGDDGSYDALQTYQRGGHLNLGSYINGAKDTWEGKFELTATISEVTTPGGGDWMSLGFNTSNTPSISSSATGSGIGTMIYRVGGDIDMFGGSALTNEVAADDVTYSGPRTLTVALDLTTYSGYNGTTNFGTVTFSDSVAGEFGSYTYTSDVNFGSIFISGSNQVTGSWDDLTLTQVIPEPSSAALLGLGGLALMLRRKRS
ncbi:MAG: PEP-CTERM sorting domain-containing protein, partial [Akkermansiaceae bacterium]|nr:PEP-CTERM sorting domain-containing protein [Akkermansiaceae bacterium]